LCRRAQFIDNENLVIERRAVFGIFAAINADIGPHAVAVLNGLPPAPEGRTVSRHTLSHDCHKASALCQTLKRLLDVTRTIGGIALTLNPPGGRRERRVHHNDAGDCDEWQHIIELFSVFPEQGSIGE
jgi:hypothetical protein